MTLTPSQNETGRLAVLGNGLSGRSAAALAAADGWIVDVYDEKSVVADAKPPEGVTLHAPWNGGPLAPVDLVVSSPGIPRGSALIRAAERLKIPVLGELEFGFRHCRSDLLAVTGTNGKTTTVEWTVHLLRALGVDAAACGNIGAPLSDFANQPNPPDVLVAEVSSFQLELPADDAAFSFAPKAAVCLNVSPDHLDRHANIDDYAKIKFRIFNNLQNSDDAILHVKLKPLWSKLKKTGFENPTWFGSDDDPSARFVRRLNGELALRATNGEFKTLARMSRTRLLGTHNADNLLAACALIENLLGPDALFDQRLNAAIQRFEPAPHRLERVGEFDGVVYVNDSKSTNPDATMAALRAIGSNHSTLLILGGVDKNMDFSRLRDARPFTRNVYLIGEAADAIENQLQGVLDITRCDSLEHAISEIRSDARPGDIALLSPACASFDMFDDYKHRGKEFKRLVREASVK